MHKRKWNVNKIEYFVKNCDNRGDLFPIDFDELPFLPKRLFVVDNVPNTKIRGQHAHKTCKQIIFCLTGEVWVINCKNQTMNTNTLFPGQAIYIPPMVWSSQVFYNNASILVIGSEPYDETDYIRDFTKFEDLR